MMGLPHQGGSQSGNLCQPVRVWTSVSPALTAAAITSLTDISQPRWLDARALLEAVETAESAVRSTHDVCRKSAFGVKSLANRDLKDLLRHCAAVQTTAH
jgi:hypothetical protein